MWNNVGFLIGQEFNNSDDTSASTKKYNKYIKNWYQIDKVPYHTSIDVIGDECYNLLSGIVTCVSQGYDTYTVNVKISSTVLMRYGNLTEVYCEEGTGIETGDLIGLADGYIIFEYCTSEVSMFKVRIDSDIFYKQNPYNYLIEDNTPEVISYSYDYLSLKFDEEEDIYTEAVEYIEELDELDDLESEDLDGDIGFELDDFIEGVEQTIEDEESEEDSFIYYDPEIGESTTDDYEEDYDIEFEEED